MNSSGLYQQVLQGYGKYINLNFHDRYISFDALEQALQNDVFKKFEYKTIGYSEEHRPIYAIDIGHGKTKILLWSQMHGNESTTTKAIFDFFNFIRKEKKSEFVKNLINNFQIRIIPMLNPDGASKYTRFNANAIDLNRDALNKSQCETQVFFKNLEIFDPDFCFNMHGQRTIFSAGKAEYPATISFLAPTYDDKLGINSSRLQAIKLIATAYKMLESFIPKQIGRYDDEHNPNCYGDYIQKLNIPTILFEAGHFPKDYNRNETRKYVLISLLRMLDSTAKKEFNYENKDLYFDIPLNKKLYLDCIIKNVKNSKSSWLGIQFKEILQNGSVVFQPFVCSLEDLSSYYAHFYIDANGQGVLINNSDQLKTDIKVVSLQINKRFIYF